MEIKKFMKLYKENSPREFFDWLSNGSGAAPESQKRRCLQVFNRLSTFTASSWPQAFEGPRAGGPDVPHPKRTTHVSMKKIRAESDKNAPNRPRNSPSNLSCPIGRFEGPNSLDLGSTMRYTNTRGSPERAEPNGGCS